MQFYKINIFHLMFFRLYAVYKKYEMIKIGNQIGEKSQVLSQARAYFFCQLYATCDLIVTLVLLMWAR